NKLASDRSPALTTSSETGSLGASTKWNVLSATSGSEPARTLPRTFAAASVNGAKATDDEVCGCTLVRVASISWPSTDRVTGTSFSGASPLLLSPAVTVIRSCPENAARANDTDGTERFAVDASATDTVRSVIPSGKCASS